MRVHFPSLSVGVLFSIGLAILLAADHPLNTLGRFDIKATESHVFVLDRETGRVWQKFLTTSSGQSDPDFAQAKKR